MGAARLWAAGMGRRQQVRRGDVRTAILAVLVDHPMHGYQVMQELTNRSGGAWAPSAGSIYPTLQQLEDEGLVRGEEQDGRRVYSLTDDGRAVAAKASGTMPWDVGGADDQDARQVFVQVAQAAMQVYQVGNAAQVAEARRILVNTRRELYGILARDESAGSADPSEGASAAATDPTDDASGATSF
jgi:DNA-binding PadR family transcriptional regulator